MHDLLTPGKLNLSIDGQFGSTGKGALNAYLATRNKIDLAISNAAPNAGHTFDLGDGRGKRTVFHLPVAGVIHTGCIIYLCAGAIIDPDVLIEEIAEFGCAGRVFVHPRAAIVTSDHKMWEQSADSGTTALASTRKGVGAALSDKIGRVSGVKLARDVLPPEMITELDVLSMLKGGRVVLMEVPQGFGLSVNHGLSYPHCTSRDITVASALNDVGLHPSWLGKVYMSVRTFPIRVGHIYDKDFKIVGNSGPFYKDSDERQWKEFGLEPELTTVTKRVRRVASFSFLQYKAALQTLWPDVVFINFVNYFEQEHQMRELMVRMNTVESQLGQHPMFLFGTGPTINDVHDNDTDMVMAMRKLGKWRKEAA